MPEDDAGRGWEIRKLSKWTLPRIDASNVCSAYYEKRRERRERLTLKGKTAGPNQQAAQTQTRHGAQTFDSSHDDSQHGSICCSSHT